MNFVDRAKLFTPVCFLRNICFQMDFVALSLKLCQLLNIRIEYSRSNKIGEGEQIRFIHELKCLDENLKCVGLSVTSKSAKQDCAKKLCFVIVNNYSEKMLSALDPVVSNLNHSAENV